MRTLRRLARTVLSTLALAAVVGAAGCKSGIPEDSEYLPSRQVYVPSFDALWERAKMTVRAEGYTLDTFHTNFAQRTIATDWLVRLAPARFKGVRHRTWIRFSEQDPNNWIIGVCVQKQRNEAIDDPLNIQRADWEWQAMDEDRALPLIWKLEHAFRQAGDELPQ